MHTCLQAARAPVVMYANADMLFFNDLIAAIVWLQESLPSFFLVGKRRDLLLSAEDRAALTLDNSPTWYTRHVSFPFLLFLSSFFLFSFLLGLCSNVSPFPGSNAWSKKHVFMPSGTTAKEWTILRFRARWPRVCPLFWWAAFSGTIGFSCGP